MPNRVYKDFGFAKTMVKKGLKLVLSNRKQNLSFKLLYVQLPLE